MTLDAPISQLGQSIGLGGIVRRRSKTNADRLWLKRVGKRIEAVILEKGYNSVYDFWVQKAGDHIARASLNYLIQGRFDPKLTTIRMLARLLKVEVSELLEE